MPEYQVNDLCRIFFRSYRIPAGVFTVSGQMLHLYADFGQRQTEMYLRDARSVLSGITEEAVLLFDERGSGWCAIPLYDQIILLGPVQTGRNPSFEYENSSEYTWQSFRDISKNLLWLLCGEDAMLHEREDDQLIRKLAGERFHTEADVNLLSFDDIFACVSAGDIEELNRLMRSGAYLAYQDRIVSEWTGAKDVFTFNLAKTYHSALNADVPISELTPLITLYMNERDSYTSLAALKSGMQRMLYDFTKYVSQYRKSGYTSAINTAVLYIREHIYTDMRVSEIADYCSMSVSSLQHRFRQETGTSVSEYILHLKTEKACYFLRNTSLSCAEIAYKMGYASQSYFIRQFRKAMNMTPGEYRRNDRTAR